MSGVDSNGLELRPLERGQMKSHQREIIFSTGRESVENFSALCMRGRAAAI
jgi:hypothetical protein